MASASNGLNSEHDVDIDEAMNEIFLAEER